MRSLEIDNNGIKAGVLTEKTAGRGYRFVYDKNYVANDKSGAISKTLPLSETEYYSEKLFPFFANLLPEGMNRSVVCRANKIDENDDFGLLCAFSGKDIIGSITVRAL